MTSHHLRPYDDGRSSGYHNQFSTNTTSSIKTPNVDVFCSDVDYGYDSSGVGFARPISMFETTMPPQRPAGLHINGNATDTGQYKEVILPNSSSTNGGYERVPIVMTEQ